MNSDRHSIGIWISHFEGRYHQLLIQGMQDAAAEQDVRLFFFNGSGVGSPYVTHIDDNMIYRFCSPDRIDGLIVPADTLGNFITLEKQHDYIQDWKEHPLLTLGMEMEGVPDLSCDNKAGMVKVVEHLIVHHRYQRIALVQGPKNNREALERVEAFRETLDKFKITMDEELIFDSDFSSYSCQSIIDKLLTPGLLPIDALVCSNDETALTIMRLLKRKGIQIPEDFAVTGFDDYPDSFLSNPSLTTLHQPIYEIGFRSVVLIAQKIRGNEIPFRTKIESHLIIRNSCGCNPKELRKKTTRELLRGIEKDKSKVTIPLDRKLMDDKSSIIKKVLNQAQITGESKDIIEKALTDILDIMAFDIRHRRPRPLCLTVFSEWLPLTLVSESSNEHWQKALMVLRSQILEDLEDTLQTEMVSEIFMQMLATLSQKVQLREAQHYLQLKQFISDLENIMDLGLSRTEEKETLRLLKEGLKSIFPCLFLIAFPENYPHNRNELTSRDLMTYSMILTADSENPKNYDDQNLQGMDLLPPDLISTENPGDILLMEIHKKEKHYGYLAMEITEREPVLIRLIENQIAGILDTIYLEKIKKEKDSEIALQTGLLHKELRSLKDLLENLPFLMVCVDPDLNVLSSNSHFQRHFPEKNLTLNFLEMDKETIKTYLSSGKKQWEGALPSLYSGDGKIFPALKTVNINQDLVLFLIDPGQMATTGQLDLSSLKKSYNLTPRELEIVEVLIRGMKIREVSKLLFIAESTVKSHIKSIYRKMDILNRDELMNLISQKLTVDVGEEAVHWNLIKRLMENSH